MTTRWYNLEEETLERGVVTHMLTNEKGEIYGLNESQYISWSINPAESKHTFYWSECYVEHGYMAVIIRNGMRLVNPTDEELSQYLEQSKKNFRG